MKVRFRNERLELVPENNDEEIFVIRLVQLVQTVSNDFVAWHGDVDFGDTHSGFVITMKENNINVDF